MLYVLSQIWPCLLTAFGLGAAFAWALKKSLSGFANQIGRAHV